MESEGISKIVWISFQIWGAFPNDIPFFLVKSLNLLISWQLIFCGISFQIWGDFPNALPFLLVKSLYLLISCQLIT